MIFFKKFLKFKNLKEFRQQSNGMNSIFEIFNFACVMCQRDPFMIEEYKNLFIESSRSILFVQNNTSNQFESSSENSIYFQLLLYWTYIFNDVKNSKLVYLSYSHALNTIKTIFLSSGNL